MASPFRVFRKHQKLMIATLAILAMGAFVFLDPLMGLIGGGGRRGGTANPVVVQWDHGALRDVDLQRMTLMRRILNRFVQRASELGAMASNSQAPTHSGFGPATERAVVQTMLFAKAAEDLGFVVSDEDINRYIQQITYNSVPPAKLRDSLAGTSLGNRKVTIDTVFAGLRTELLAQALLSNYLIAADSTTPLELWLTWQRLNDRATVEILPVPVAEFVDKVNPPGDAELQAFFHRYKDVVKRPVVVGGVQLQSPRPGFKVPRRVTFEFVRAEYDQFVDDLAPEITDDEIAEYYENNKRSFVRPDLLDDPTQPPTDEEPSNAADKPEKPAAPKRPAIPAEGEQAKPPEPPEDPAGTDGKQPQTEDEPTEDKPGTETAPSQPAAPAEGEQAKPPEPPEDPAGTEGKQPQTEDEPTEDKPDAEDDGQAKAGDHDTGRNFHDTRRSPFRLVAEQVGGPPPSSDRPPPADNAQPVPEAQPDAGTAGTTEEGPDQTTGQPDTTAAAAQPVADDPSQDDQQSEPQYTPLEEVKEEIRRDLARQRAPERMIAALTPLRQEVRRYYDDLQLWAIREQDDRPDAAGQTPRPTPPDARAWADEHGLAFEQTAALSYFELEQTDLGRSMITDEGQILANQAFDVLDNYRPVVSEDRMGNRYLAWRVAATPERVPRLEEIKEQVVTAWKAQAARELARGEAERLANEARAAGKPLAELFPADKGYEVVRSDPFSWFTLGPVPGGRNVRPRLSEVYGVDGAGPEFMEAVFALGDGEVGVALNHAQSVAHVIRLVGREQSQQAMREEFLKDFEVLGQMVRQQGAMQVISTLLADLQEVFHVEGWEALDVDRWGQRSS